MNIAANPKNIFSVSISLKNTTDIAAPNTDSSVIMTAVCEGGEYFCPKACSPKQTAVHMMQRYATLSHAEAGAPDGAGANMTADIQDRTAAVPNWTAVSRITLLPRTYAADTIIWSA